MGHPDAEAGVSRDSAASTWGSDWTTGVGSTGTWRNWRPIGMKYDDEFDDWMIQSFPALVVGSRTSPGALATWACSVPLRPGDGDHQTGIALGKANPTHPKRMKVFMCFVYNIKLAKICLSLWTTRTSKTSTSHTHHKMCYCTGWPCLHLGLTKFLTNFVDFDKARVIHV